MGSQRMGREIVGRILFFPGGSSLSHLNHCLRIARQLEERGHLVMFAISARHTGWASLHGIEFRIVPEPWEQDESDHPTTAWFMDRDFLLHCIMEEAAAIKEFRPDVVVSDFKFTTRISAEYSRVPCVGMGIVSMLKATRANFGFVDGDEGRAARLQQDYLRFFYEFILRSLNTCRRRLHQPLLEDPLEFLEGDLTLIHDLPDFHFMDSVPGPYTVIGPVHSTPPEHSEAAQIHNDLLTRVLQRARGTPLILVIYGCTCRRFNQLKHLADCLNSGPWHVVICASGLDETKLTQLKKIAPRASIVPMCLMSLFDGAAELMICHGGLGAIFDAVRMQVPVLVIPTQPEQDHNGMLCERHGIGVRPWKSMPFPGRSDFFESRLLKLSAKEITGLVEGLLNGKKTGRGLSRLYQAIERYEADGMRPELKAAKAIEGFL